MLSFASAVGGTDGPILPSVVRVADDVGAFVDCNLRVDRYVLNLDDHWNVGLCDRCGLGCIVYINCRVCTVAVIAPVDCICVMLDVCALELAAAWPDPAATAARSHCSFFSIRGGPTYRHAT